jgi:hypothetical protein
LASARIRKGRSEDALMMGNALQDKTVVVVGRGSGIARAVPLRARAEVARVVVAGRDKDKLAGTPGYLQPPLEQPPPDGTVLICCTAPRNDLVVDL